MFVGLSVCLPACVPVCVSVCWPFVSILARLNRKHRSDKLKQMDGCWVRVRVCACARVRGRVCVCVCVAALLGIGAALLGLAPLSVVKNRLGKLFWASKGRSSGHRRPLFGA